jgi:hypothetical protein
MKMKKHWSALLGLVAVVGVGCSGEEAEPAPIPHSRLGLVSVSYEHDWVDSQEGALLTTTAQFVRYAASDHEQVARLLALPLEPARDLPGMDRCQVYDTTLDLGAEADMETGQTNNVELLEAGNLQVQTRDQIITLMPRHFPGLLPSISGVIYGEAQTTLDQQPDRIRATSRGSEAVGQFLAQVQSPTLPRLTHIGYVEPTDNLLLPRGDDLSLQWQNDGASSRDVTYVELRYSNSKRELALRCRLRDDGEFSIPAERLVQISGRVSLELTRLRRVAFSTGGLDRGELRVSIRDSAALQLQD